MSTELTTYAEKQAELAESLHAFSGLKLLHIKRNLADLLKLIGRDGFFSTYTGHDISHVDEMLSMLEWLIPDSTKKLMSPADWLLIVLAIYFHDVGMIVTEAEYEEREASDFKAFKAKIMAGALGVDYREKVNALGAEKGERFMYQEFVRHKHPERVKNWILGRAAEHLGVNPPVVGELGKLVSAADSQFVADLATICESHHLNDLNELGKYPLRRAYGNSDAQTANVQYAAVLLRTADLLHITRDRTPSVMFSVINMTDPVSQEEWAKQQAVRRVKPRSERDSDGKIDESIPKHTIEVHATFKAVEGFFGLTSYLSYVGEQLKASFGWVEFSNKHEASAYEFPWRKIDDSEIIATGFLKQSFEFTLDQGRILDLLTGHTLYNDSTVVLRELTQNSLDAVRLQHQLDLSTKPGAKIGHIGVTYNSATRDLTVTDSGTGMTQEIIEKHFLKVGSSRYQDAEFKKKFPTFCAISRFGIGVLSAFMIADSVEVTTCHPEDADARHLTLKSVHGKYLIRLLDKASDPVVKSLLPHGTSMKLRLRASVKPPDVLRVMRNWILFPGCDVTVKVDDQPEVKIGFKDPRAALEASIASITNAGELSGRHKVEQVEVGGISLAYALTWSEYFHEWSFLRPVSRNDPEGMQVGVGMCIGGVRVELTTPGFAGLNIVAIANATGADAPRTNVARSKLEATEQWDRTVETIYSKFCDHVTSEVNRMQEENGHSLTWAAQEAPFLMAPLTNATHPKILNAEISKIPALLVEVDNKRIAMAPSQLSSYPLFWTIGCEFFSHAEWLIREVQSDASLSALIQSLNAKGLGLPSEPVLCMTSKSNPLVQNVMEDREVDFIRILPDQRRADLRWARQLGTASKWISLKKDIVPSQRRFQVRGLLTNLLSRTETDSINPFSLQIRVGAVNVEGQGDYDAVSMAGDIFLFASEKLVSLLTSLISRAAGGGDADFEDAALVLTIVAASINRTEVVGMEKLLGTIEEQTGIRPSSLFPFEELAELMRVEKLKAFDALAWRRATVYM
ncbi:MAG: HD domain-containing protein [Phycisphaerae bacterium]